jgi:actin-related protein 8
LTAIAPAPTATTTASGANAANGTNGHNNGPDEESKDLLQPRPQSFSRLQDGGSKTPLSSIAGSPAPDLEATPQPDLKDAVDGANDSDAEEPVSIERRDDILPVYPLDSAILTSIIHAARSSPQKTRDFLGGIMLIGGSSTIPGLAGHLEEALQALQPGYAKATERAGCAGCGVEGWECVWKDGENERFLVSLEVLLCFRIGVAFVCRA